MFDLQREINSQFALASINFFYFFRNNKFKPFINHKPRLRVQRWDGAEKYGYWRQKYPLESAQ